MSAPTLSAEDKAAIVAELQKLTGGADKADTVKNFLKTLAENNRLGLLRDICEKFGELMGAVRGEVELTVTSASVSLLCCIPSHQSTILEKRNLYNFFAVATRS
jgi:F-type H+-transporting ATPase subunit O